MLTASGKPCTPLWDGDIAFKKQLGRGWIIRRPTSLGKNTKGDVIIHSTHMTLEACLGGGLGFKLSIIVLQKMEWEVSYLWERTKDGVPPFYARVVKKPGVSFERWFAVWASRQAGCGPQANPTNGPPWKSGVPLTAWQYLLHVSICQNFKRISSHRSHKL